ncbi:MAG: tetratricopeptide repeat protein [Candidatus Omnitrophota bacterium]
MKKMPFLLLVLALFFTLPAKSLFADPAAQQEPSVLAEGQPSVLKEDKAQANYVYDLKMLVAKSRENIKNVNEKIKNQAVLKRNQQREERAREYFLQAQKLADEGRLEESRQMYEKAIAITEHPEMKYYIKESEHRAKAQKAALSRQEGEQQRRSEEEEKTAFERVESIYQGAVSLYKQQRFKEARAEFQTVEEVFPDYKAVRSYLQIIEQDIVQSERQAIKAQQKEIESQQKESEIARLREKELWRKEVDRKEEDRQKQVQKQAQDVYDTAIRLYQDRKYKAAKEKFQEVEWVVPDFKATRSYLQRIDRDLEVDQARVTEEREKVIEKQRWDETLAQKRAEEDRKKAEAMRDHQQLEGKKDQAEFIYQSGIALFDKGQLDTARERFDEVEALYPDYRSTRDYLKRIHESVKSQISRDEELRQSAAEKKILEEENAHRKADKEKFKQQADEADALYTQAFDLYKIGRLVEAKAKFLEVDQRVPDYKSARSYLKRIDDDIAAMVSANRKDGDLASQKEQLERLKDLRDRADLVYNDAILAYDNKDFTSARAKFQEVEGIYPNYKKAVSYLSRIEDDITQQQKDEQRREVEKKVDALYAQALALYEKEAFEEAKAKFIDVASLIPDYKQTAFYLERIDDDVIRSKQRSIDTLQQSQAEALYNQAVSLYQSGQFTEAKDKYLQLETVISGYKDTAKVFANIDADIDRKKQQDEERSKAARAEVFYQQALALYQGKDFAAAKDKFVQTEVVYADYKDTPKYLLSINSDIKKQAEDLDLKKKNDTAEPLYAQALALYREQDFEAAKRKFLQAQMACPGYKETERYLARVDEDIRLVQARLAREEKLSKVEAIYATAMDLYSSSKFVEAKAKLQEAAALESNYRNVKSYLARIDDDIRREQARQDRLVQEQQVERPYSEAVALYHMGKFEEAKPKFQQVVAILPDYKKAKYYFSRIDENILAQKREEDRKSLERAESLYREASLLFRNGYAGKAYQKYIELDQVYPDYKATRQALADLKKKLSEKVAAFSEPPHLPDAVPAVNASKPPDQDDEKVLGVYKDAVALYKEKNYPGAKGRFEEVERLQPGYRSARKYLDMIAAIVPPARPAPVIPATPAVPVSLPKPVVPTLTLKESLDKQQLAKDSKTVDELTQRSGVLYHQIRALAEDKDFAQAAKTFSKIDQIVANLEQEKKRLARTIEREEKLERERQERQKKLENEAHLNEKDAAVRREGLKQAQAQKKEDEDRARQAASDKEQQDLKRKEQARLAQVKELEKETRLKTEVLYQQGQNSFNDKNYSLARERFADALKLMPGYKDIEILMVRIDQAEGEQKLLEQEKADRARVASIAEKANAVNLEALALSNAKNFPGLQQKFDELSSLLQDIQGIKGHMLANREDFRKEWEGKLAAARAKADAPKPIKDMKAMVEGRTARQQAEAFYKQGEQFYNAGQYAEARVKFRDSFAADPTFKAAYTFSLRVDRILEHRDFEEQQGRAKKEKRHFDDKQEGLAPSPVDDAALAPDPARAKQVYADGIELYKQKKFKEARIKFEELSKVGDTLQRAKAVRYLNLIETALDKARQDAEKERAQEEARYLEGKRLETRMALERDKGLPVKELVDDAENSQHAQDAAVERQVLLRSIEQENDAERKKMLSERLRQKDIAEQKAAAEWGQVRKFAVHQDVKMGDKAPTIPGKPPEIQTPAVPVKKVPPAASKPKKDGVSVQPEKQVTVPAEVKTETESRKKLAKGSMKQRPLVVTATDSREDAQFQRLIARQKVIEAKETERKRLIMEREHQAHELEKMRVEEKQRRAREAQLRRDKKELKDASSPVPMPVKKPAVTVVAPLPAVTAPLPAAVPLDVYHAAANEEKRRLEEQRAAIARDFEDGVERLYVEALDLYKKHAYEEAKEDLTQVNELIKGYKKSEQYLISIDKELSKPSRRSKGLSSSSSAIRTDRRGEAVASMLDQAEHGAVK